ncbi:MAG TPA: type II CAAX endopeptidase family protein [Rhodanobacteraceae bacterium]|jgi:membrane protease YdiL (CAAX protease family)|nr:type II CAAX endopeptidase family protein [Rhodanobacteraceae bacterium]
MVIAIRLRQAVWIVLVIGAVALIDWDFAIVVAALLAVAAVAFETRAPLRDLGLARPRSIMATIAVGIGFGVVLLVFSKLLLTPSAEALTGIPRDLSAFDDVRGDWTRFLSLMPKIWIGAAIGEEIVFRSFLIGRLEAAFGGSARAATATSVLLSSVVFGAAHAYQGPTGILITGVLGLVFAIVYVAAGRRLWLNVVAHGVYDTLSLALVVTSYDRVLTEIGQRLIPH